MDIVFNIKKTMCHHTLKGVVCDRHLFFGCSEIKTSYIPHPEGCGLISDIIDKTGRKIRLTRKQYSHICKKHPKVSNYFEEIKETLIKPDKIKKTMCHPHLKVWVCCRHLFFGCSEMKTVKSTTTS